MNDTTHPPISISSGRQIVAWLAVGGSFLLLFWPTFLWMAERFDAPDSFYSHGWLIPLASGWLIGQRRAALRACELRASFGGLALLIPSLALHIVATWWRIHVLSGVAMLGALWGLVWACWGRQALWALRFPLLFLLFMVPLPGVLLITISFKMKLLAAALATTSLQLLGLSAVQAGSTIQLPGLSVVVDDTCSGLRSLISLVALSSLWTSLMGPNATRWHKLTVVAASIPIALAANMVRIVLLVLVAAIYGPAVADGFLHYGSGIVVFGIALALLAWLSQSLSKMTLGSGFRVQGSGQLPRSQNPRPRALFKPAPSRSVLRPQPLGLLCLVLASSLLWASQAPASKGLAARQSVPEMLGLWVGSTLAVDRRAVEILETEDVSLMEYRMGEEPPVWLAMVEGFGTRAAFHPPELCYVGSHFEVLERGPIAIMVNGRPRRVMRLVIGQDGQRYEAWYWFTAADRMTPSYYQQQWWLIGATIRQRPASGTLVRISTPLDGVEKSHQRLLAFVNAWDVSQSGMVTHGS